MIFIDTADARNAKVKNSWVKDCMSEKVLRQMKLCLFQSGEYIFQEGEKAEYLYIILDGRCKVFKTLENGRTLLICCYQDVQILGEFELFSNSMAKTSVQALTDTYCLAITVSDHKSLLLSDNQFLNFVCRQTCSKVERNNQNTGINLLYPLEQRLAGYILVMQNNGIFSSNYTYLAEYLGCSYRHLLRTFHSLCSKHILEKKGTTYILRDVDSLQHLTGEMYQQ